MGTPLDLTGYKLTFDDEFNSFSSSPAGGDGQWKTQFYFDGRSLPSNGEQQFYSDSTVGVHPFALNNGALDITAAPSANADASGGLPYTSGLITTENNFSQTYGYFEMRAQLPQGQGMWPAFWLLPTDKSWPPEIDALEAFGAPNSRGEGGAYTYHWGSIGGGGEWAKVDANIYDSFHTYGVDWQADKLTYYFDGQQVGQTETPAGFDKPMYMLANLAVGGNWAENAAGDTAHMSVDYIRAFSNDPNAHEVAAQPVSSPDGAPAPSTVTPAEPAPEVVAAPAPGDAAPAPVSGDDPVLQVNEDALHAAPMDIIVDAQPMSGQPAPSGTLDAIVSYGEGSPAATAVQVTSFAEGQVMPGGAEDMHHLFMHQEGNAFAHIWH